MNKKYNNLFETFTFKNGVTLKNRVVMAPMTTWSSNDDYTVSDEELTYYQKRVNGVGLVITGCTHVQPNGIGFTNEFAAYDDKFIPSLRKLAGAAKSGGAPAILQIFHGGNKALPALTPNGEVVSSSALETEASDFAPSVLPRELSHDEILEVIHAFGETTRRAIEAGFDGVEIHGAHGFLLQNFFSPFFNRREDEWGGSLENRLRFPLAVVQEIKNVIKKHATKPFILGYRISPDEHQTGGLRMKDTYELINRLIEANVDYVHASLANALSSKPVDSKDDKTYLELIAEHVNNRVPVIAAGSMVTADDVKTALDKGLSLAAIGHTLIMNPDWVEKVQNGKEGEIETALKASKINEIEIPEKLWNVIQASGPWFKVEE
ncbi:MULTISPECIES: NADH-dependent flavin oxidoreductase [Priestia]|jgi:2,4-dienoyl-CoA reductase-like NADH-dependent reductase (Old Yellow Enzyme family)|uniref:NADH-dependent flavin oxidoreductase, oye family n=1 Tax=Priestia megaterium (strain ATCC 12872 / QMB1551) TaxID=545693 RepID=D5E477_PRIM1|nr:MULTISPECIES: NADH-dependent flavin oxidoreductase [Priestia]ADE72602.1 NADH-dependent flavin oxidoreductase, oye family [Priestia megaterium QM B1551]MBG9930885.1 NADH:flavin oxidoreductase [Priestia aryabhattai]MCT9853967.1 NADH-dependent flavin oxidoreductase [Priestia megaterium]MDF1964503.1 NADH-dependent flavin oxidoreductase [Priestia megaterium]MDF2014211.1 NADH-dependent flavin oxidoreductase [Priestia megaterium]